MSLKTFVNPHNGYSEKLNTVSAGVLTFLFGPIYLTIKGVWPHAIAYLFIAIFLISVGLWPMIILLWIVYAVAAGSIIEKSYLRKGWKPGEGEGVPGVKKSTATLGILLTCVAVFVLMGLASMGQKSIEEASAKKAAARP